jgi:hypothetical protein
LSEKGKKGPKGPDFKATNLAVTQTKRDPVFLGLLLQQFVEENRPLNGVNVATILYDAAKAPSVLTPDVLKYLARTLESEELSSGTWLSAQGVGNALYGLQSLGDSEEVRMLVAAMTPKVLGCREKLTGWSPR